MNDAQLRGLPVVTVTAPGSRERGIDIGLGTASSSRVDRGNLPDVARRLS